MQLEEIVKQTDEEFFRLHPEWKNRNLGAGSPDAAGSKEAELRKEWARLLLKRKGEISEEELKKVAGGVGTLGTAHILSATTRVLRGA
jgi:hypothetical protein